MSLRPVGRPRARPPAPSALRLALLLATALFLWRAHATADPAFATSHLPHYHGHAPPMARPAATAPSSLLDGLRALVAVASFDFMQLSHLEEVLDGFMDLCYAGARVDIVVYTTVVYPVALIDMLNDRLRCNNPSPKAGLTMTLMLKPSKVRLHLVDFLRQLFYDRLEQYDVFVYTEVSGPSKRAASWSAAPRRRSPWNALRAHAGRHP